VQCREEFPLINRLVAAVDSLPVRVLGVNMQEKPRQIARTQSQHKLQFDILVDAAGVFARRYGIYGLPQVMVIDKQGRLRYRDYGLPSDVVNALKALLAEE